ncbi:MAG: hypothetical protein WKF30_00980 [Pyrinomonadaceae bacterium]
MIPGPSSTPWISGGRNASSEITIDGTSIILPENNVSINTLAYTPSVDAVEEFSVITNSLAAEYGRSGGRHQRRDQARHKRMARHAV